MKMPVEMEAGWRKNNACWKSLCLNRSRNDGNNACWNGSWMDENNASICSLTINFDWVYMSGYFVEAISSLAIFLWPTLTVRLDVQYNHPMNLKTWFLCSTTECITIVFCWNALPALLTMTDLFLLAQHFKFLRHLDLALPLQFLLLPSALLVMFLTQDIQGITSVLQLRQLILKGLIMSC